MGLQRFHYDVVIAQNENVTTAALDTGDAQIVYSPVGEAKKHPNDEFDSLIGTTQALARLFHQMGEDYQATAEKMVAEGLPEWLILDDIEPGESRQTNEDMLSWFRNLGVPEEEI